MYRSFLFNTGLGERGSLMPRPFSSPGEIQCRCPQFQPTSNPDYPLERPGLLVRARAPVLGLGSGTFRPSPRFASGDAHREGRMAPVWCRVAGTYLCGISADWPSPRMAAPFSSSESYSKGPERTA